MSYPSNPTNPFAPPGPQPPPHAQDPHAQDPQAWAPVQQHGYAAAAPAGAPHQPFVPAPRGGNGLAITAIVLSGLALVGMLAMAAFFIVAPIVGGGSFVLYGEVDPLGTAVSDVVLQQAIGTALEDRGSMVDELECPEQSPVGQGLVTVCHGSVDGFDWTGVVVFEDADGAFIVTEY